VTSLPSGTVTLLFTDVEGSTGLAESLGDAWAEVLEEHRRILRAEVGARWGTEVDCRGDELFAVFTDAASAVQAAAAAQRALRAHAWPEGVSVRVRMGLHTGAPTLGSNGYVGVDVHRAARVCSAAHGGQILLTGATRDAAGAEAHDLGERSLRGLPRPEPLFELVAPGLEQGFPPPRAEPPPPLTRTKVVLADDSVLLREGIASLLEDCGFDVAARCGTGDELLLAVGRHAPDVAIVDLRMPPTHTDEGLRAAREIRGRYPEVGVLLLSQYVEPVYARELVADDERGVGYLLKDRIAAVDEFAAAVRSIAEGGTALDPELASL
jgi:class 3 adenylate cyclase/CheY-like chemotaxis protein